jgi:hypothetical protein
MTSRGHNSRSHVRGASVVRREDDDGLVEHAVGLEGVHDETDAVVEELHHGQPQLARLRAVVLAAVASIPVCFVDTIDQLLITIIIIYSLINELIQHNY